MSSSPASSRGLTRRGLFAGSAGLALLVAGCTSSSGQRRDAAATSRQADALAGQVAVQESLVAAYAAAGAASPALAAQIAPLQSQAQQQLTRLKAAAPSAGSRSLRRRPRRRPQPCPPGRTRRRGCAPRSPPRPTRTRRP